MSQQHTDKPGSSSSSGSSGSASSHSNGGEKKPIMTPKLAAALNAAGVTDEGAKDIISAIARAVGKDPNDYALSCEAIRASRESVRQSAAAKKSSKK